MRTRLLCHCGDDFGLRKESTLRRRVVFSRLDEIRRVISTREPLGCAPPCLRHGGIYVASFRPGSPSIHLTRGRRRLNRSPTSRTHEEPLRRIGFENEDGAARLWHVFNEDPIRSGPAPEFLGIRESILPQLFFVSDPCECCMEPQRRPFKVGLPTLRFIIRTSSEFPLLPAARKAFPSLIHVSQPLRFSSTQKKWRFLPLPACTSHRPALTPVCRLCVSSSQLTR
jgi:hypothetical protein